MINNEIKKRILSSIILIPLVLYLISSGSFYLIFLILICLFISIYEWNKMVKKKEIKFLGIFFLFYSFYSFYQISNFYFLIFILLVCISTDIGGFLFGKFFKGPKLTKISPNKTYAGLIGSYFFSTISTLLYLNWFNFTSNIKWFIFTLIISTVSQMGDIFISYFKRKSNIKDTGKIIPGHGGLLDRIDGMIFAFPVFHLISLFNYTP